MQGWQSRGSVCRRIGQFHQFSENFTNIPRYLTLKRQKSIHFSWKSTITLILIEGKKTLPIIFRIWCSMKLCPLILITANSMSSFSNGWPISNSVMYRWEDGSKGSLKNGKMTMITIAMTLLYFLFIAKYPNKFHWLIHPKFFSRFNKREILSFIRIVV